jgi:PEGA domain
MIRRTSVAALLAALSFLASSRAHADDPAPNKAEAAQRFDRGLQLFNEGDNAGALAEFKQTYAIMPNPIVLFNIGLVYAAMGRPVDAVDALSAVVGAGSLSPEQRERAQSTLTDQQARIGRVSVTTLPDGATIDIDGVEVAKTPLTAPLRVAEGSHVIGAVAEGYAHAHKEIVVAGNADASVSFELVLGQSKVPANLTLHSRTAEAEVLLDGKSAGKTPLTTSLSIASGHHTVELRRPGYTPGKQDVDLGEGATGEVTLDLAIDQSVLASVGADLALALRDPNADVTVDDQHLGLYTRPLRLPKGAHHVRLEVAGYLPFEQDITLEPGKPNTLTPFLSPTPETRQAHDSNLRAHRTWGFITMGAGVAIAGASGILLAANSSTKSAAQRDVNGASDARDQKLGICDIAAGGDANQCNANVSDAQARLDKANSTNLVGFIGLGVGGAAIATGLVVLLTGESSHRFDAPGHAQSKAPARGTSLALLPGPGQLGLALGGAF